MPLIGRTGGSIPGELRFPGRARVEQWLEGTPRHFDIHFLWPPLSFTWAFLNQYNYLGSCCGVNLTDLSPYQALQEQLTSVVQEIGHLIDPIATAARGEAAQLGHKVTDAGCGDPAKSARRRWGWEWERILILLLLFLKGSWPVLEPGQCWPTLEKRPLSLPQQLLQKWPPRGSLLTWHWDRNCREIFLGLPRWH